jgi:hypothetical protein
MDSASPVDIHDDPSSSTLGANTNIELGPSAADISNADSAVDPQPDADDPDIGVDRNLTSGSTQWASSTMHFSQPLLAHRFSDPQLEYAYQLYSMRQRHRPLQLLNWLNLLLALAEIALPVCVCWFHLFGFQLTAQTATSGLTYSSPSRSTFHSLTTTIISTSVDGSSSKCDLLSLPQLLFRVLTLSLPLWAPSFFLILLVGCWRHFANHYLHYVALVTAALTLLLSQLPLPQLLHTHLLFQDSHCPNGRFVDWPLDSLVIQLRPLQSTTWHLMYTLFAIFVLLPLPLRWSVWCASVACLVDLVAKITRSSVIDVRFVLQVPSFFKQLSRSLFHAELGRRATDEQISFFKL